MTEAQFDIVSLTIGGRLAINRLGEICEITDLLDSEGEITESPSEAHFAIVKVLEKFVLVELANFQSTLTQ